METKLQIDASELPVGDGETVIVQKYDEAHIKELLENAPEVRFRHPSKFTDDEDKIIASCLALRTPIYRIAESLRCGRALLLRHIDEDPVLKTIREEAEAKERDQVEEAIDDLVRLRCANAVIWKAERLLSDKYGKDSRAQTEDETHLVLGVIPEDDIAQGDALLAEAASKPPEVGLSALLTADAKAMVEKSVSGEGKNGEDLPPASIPVSPASTPSDSSTPPPPQSQPEPEPESYGDGFGDTSFDSSSWMD